MGCGLCAPKAARYSAAVSPSAQSVGKAFADAKAPASVPSRPDRWRREVPKDASEGKESEGPRDGAMEVPKLPGVPAEAPPQPETSHAEPEEPAETAEARAGLAEAGRYEELQPAKQEEVRREKVKEERTPQTMIVWTMMKWRPRYGLWHRSRPGETARRWTSSSRGITTAATRAPEQIHGA
ncbi:unnamed protein product [Effrenium voratum]|uniref:Uncharacterized protein n=1 Tax=Effrenium voratum TaxID=2562239 RepID=A0AA36HWR4_9DINO|nr:unnamed protein product [Effrenium voratum]